MYYETDIEGVQVENTNVNAWTGIVSINGELAECSKNVSVLQILRILLLLMETMMPRIRQQLSALMVIGAH